MQIEFLLKQGSFNVVFVSDVDGHVHEVDGCGSVAKFPGKTQEQIHCCFEVFPFQHISFCILVGGPYANHIINETAIKDDAFVVMWKKFFSVYAIIDGCIWWGRGCAHGCSI